MPKTAHKVVVIGHRNPDTDSICSAIAYAELKNKTSDLVCEARRAGKMNQETEFVLKKFGVKPPRMCTDVNPKIRDVDYREMPGIPGATSLRRAWEIRRDQKIDTLPITSAENDLEGIITVKDIATANMDVFDTGVLAKSRTSFRNILETLGATMVLCFSLGLALTLVTVGVGAAISVQQAAKRWSGFNTMARKAPYFSSVLIAMVGLYMGIHGYMGIVG